MVVTMCVDGVARGMADVPALAPRVASAAAGALRLCRERHDGGDALAAMEAYLIVASMREWEQRNDTALDLDVEDAWGDATLPTRWSEQQLADVRMFYRGTRVASEGATAVRSARSGADVARGLRQLAGGMFAAETAAPRLTGRSGR